ncbi:hypothetical protein ACFLYN_03880 [Chloroflexota bacterium]
MYILLPVIVLVLSVVITAWFYHLLPEQVGYRFQSDGLADRFTSSNVIVLWALIPQLVLTLIAAGLTWGIIRLIPAGERFENVTLKPHTILLFIGNMIALPQVILCFAMLDIFSYNSYQVHWLPLWILILIIAGGGAIIMGIYFLRSLWRVQAAKKE